jgi:hypothetical protein
MSLVKVVELWNRTLAKYLFKDPSVQVSSLS